MNLDEYKLFYVNDENHWYISKIKQFTSKSINDLAHGLNLFIKLLNSKPSKTIINEFENFIPKNTQLNIFGESDFTQIPINKHSKLFIALCILNNSLVDFGQVAQKNPVKATTFKKIIKDFKDGKDYNYIVKKYGESFISSELEVHFRNFESWLTKFGFIGRINETEYCFFTPIGIEFAKSYKDLELSSAIFLNQIKKLQVWNPTMDKKYQSIKVIPYYLIIKILLSLNNNKFSKREYVLFITKLKNHNKKEIENCLKLIYEYRKLSKLNQNKYIEDIIKLDLKKYKNRERTNYDRIKDSSTKEIGAYTFGGVTSIDEVDNEVKLINIEKAENEIKEFEKSIKYIEFKRKEDWIWHFGSLNGLSVENILEMYVNEGQTLNDIVSKLGTNDESIKSIILDKIFEKEIEDYYETNIKEINSQLEVVNLPEYGRQFATPIGPIDLLCQNKKTKEYYVIEFKRAQVSDDTIGQILRYMGWVHLVMERKRKTVYGIVVGNDFPDKFSYAMEGIQSPHIYKIIEQFKHNFNEKNKPPKKGVLKKYTK